MKNAVRTNPFEHLRFASETSGNALSPSKVVPAPFAEPVLRQPEAALDPEMALLFSWLCERAGVSIDHYRTAVLQRRAGACLRAVRCGSCAEALAAARQDPAKAERLLDALMVGVTSFFRDPLVFSALKRRWSRQANEDAPADRPWSVVSVGCSDGAELYSCAMLLDSLGLLDRVRLLGTDCRPGAIRTARAGLYKPEWVEELGQTMGAAYFESQDGLVRVREPIRAACAWGVRDAMDQHGTSAHDVILCRNLAIYLTADGAGRLWAHLAGQLRPAGLLVVGRAERPPADLFRKVGPCMYERTGGRS